MGEKKEAVGSEIEPRIKTEKKNKRKEKTIRGTLGRIRTGRKGERSKRERGRDLSHFIFAQEPTILISVL